jgi:hypothetical protein
MRITCFMFLLIPLTSPAQKANPDLLPSKKLNLVVDRIAPAEIKFPFSSIKIIDNRFDTSKLGFEPTAYFGKRLGRKIVLDSGLAISLEKYYNGFYQNSFSTTDLKLLVVIKKLWLSCINNNKNRDMDIVKNDKSHTFLYCKLEYYLNTGDKYYPYKRLDTVINGVAFEVANNDISHYKSRQQVLKLVLKGLIETMDFNNAMEKIEKLHPKTIEEVERFNTSFFNIPVLKDTGIAKGVFVSFDEFKNNRPSIIDFTEKEIRIKGSKKENYLEDSKGNLITHYWGYNTGEYLKVGKYGNDKMYRKNNTFEFFAIFQNLQVNNSFFPTSTYKDYEYWMPYQLDMETGEIY